MHVVHVRLKARKDTILLSFNSAETMRDVTEKLTDGMTFGGSDGAVVHVIDDIGRELLVRPGAVQAIFITDPKAEAEFGTEIALIGQAAMTRKIVPANPSFNPH